MTTIFFYSNKRGMGMGHLKRCSTLAEQLSVGSWRMFPYDRSALKNIKCYQPDVVVIDALDIDPRLVAKIRALPWRPVVAVIETVEKLVEYDADIVLNPFATLRNSIWKTGGRTFITGPDYNIMDLAFGQAHKKKRIIRKSIKRILVVCGGEDPKNLTLKAVRYFASTKYSRVVVVLGKKFRHALPPLPDNFTIKKDLPNLAAEFLRCDVAVVAGGTTAYEAAVSGAPACIMPKDRLEAKNMAFFEKAGVGLVGLKNFRKLADQGTRAAMSRAGKGFIRPVGAKVILRLMDDLHAKRN